MIPSDEVLAEGVRAQRLSCQWRLLIHNRFAPRFETRKRHQKSEPNYQSKQPKERMLQCGNVAAYTLALGPCAQSPPKFAR